eukprot:CAMPEP_0168427596 /NCGR_PEP_ID=MMETSP0228-20121227/36432_1 /TAXON_ID=133427 /ORGANISM="Protoceratium reticulatum, Strain CCCM 535 (=CCMP 1889)" /LENGTH=41 /DNA_ID= /DNA_START= /DNA_END= /DNA_ORIENTATION=
MAWKKCGNECGLTLLVQQQPPFFFFDDDFFELFFEDFLGTV